LQEAPSSSRSRLGSILAPREDAFPAALRHTARVARLRRLTLWGSGMIVAIVGVIILFQMLRFLPVDLRFSHIGLKGSRITIETPRLVGYRQDGRPYALKARLGIQDMSKPDLFELENLEVRLETSGESAVLLEAGHGLYDAKKDRADLTEAVRIHDGKNFDLLLQSGVMDFKASTLTSDRPAKLKLDGGEVASNAAEFSQTERRATFTGDVHSVLYGEADDDGPSPTAADEAAPMRSAPEAPQAQDEDRGGASARPKK
jgi:lipopolysaccharide export system protein LptC